MPLIGYVALVVVVLVILYIALSYQVYRRAFVPPRPTWLDDFTFTPFEFQADYEEVELTTADGVNFGAWHFRQPGSPQTVLLAFGLGVPRSTPEYPSIQIMNDVLGGLFSSRLNMNLRETHGLCDEHDDVATASLLEVWIDEAERRTWFLFEATRRAEP